MSFERLSSLPLLFQAVGKLGSLYSRLYYCSIQWENPFFQAQISELNQDEFKMAWRIAQVTICLMDISVPALCWHMIAYDYIQQYIDTTVFWLGIWQQVHTFHRSAIRESYSLPPIYEKRKKRYERYQRFQRQYTEYVWWLHGIFMPNH